MIRGMNEHDADECVVYVELSGHTTGLRKHITQIAHEAIRKHTERTL